MCKITFNTDSGCLRMLKEDGSSIVIGYISYTQIAPMHGESDVKCVRISPPDNVDGLPHIGSLYPDEIISNEKVPA